MAYNEKKSLYSLFYVHYLAWNMDKGPHSEYKA